MHCPWIIATARPKAVDRKTLLQGQEYFPLDNYVLQASEWMLESHNITCSPVPLQKVLWRMTSPVSLTNF